MREIRTSGLMSGEGKRSDANAVQTTAPFLDSTEAVLYRWIYDLLGGSEWRCVEVLFSVGTKWAGSRSWVRKWIGFVDLGMREVSSPGTFWPFSVVADGLGLWRRQSGGDETSFSYERMIQPMPKLGAVGRVAAGGFVKLTGFTPRSR